MIGTDISPAQSTWVPPNLTFEIEDATMDWTFPENHFDYVHLRYLFGSIADWPRLLSQAYRVCKPGGYVESYEASCVFRSEDGTLLPGSPLDEWGKVFVEAGKKFGRPFDVVGDGLVQDAFKKAGFSNIVEWEFKVSNYHGCSCQPGSGYSNGAVPCGGMASEQEVQGDRHVCSAGN